LALEDLAKEHKWLPNKTMQAHTLRKNIVDDGFMSNLICLDGCMSLKRLKVVTEVFVVL
jgi:hypothetical protein